MCVLWTEKRVQYLQSYIFIMFYNPNLYSIKMHLISHFRIILESGKGNHFSSKLWLHKSILISWYVTFKLSGHMILKNDIWTWKSAIWMFFCLFKWILFLKILLEVNFRRSEILDLPQNGSWDFRPVTYHCTSILLSWKGNNNTCFR